MSTLNLKTLVFEYFISEILRQSDSNSLFENDLSILKTQKLLFLLVVAEIDGGSSFLIDNVFNNFIAMPFGPVEVDVYYFCKKEKLNSLVINDKYTRPKNGGDVAFLPFKYKGYADNAVQQLLKRNPKIFTLKSITLVEITQMYNCWKKSYAKARENQSFREPINVEAIKEDFKYFKLNPFELI
jgi:uncharacterized phage-associated protein